MKGAAVKADQVSVRSVIERDPGALPCICCGDTAFCLHLWKGCKETSGDLGCYSDKL